MWLSRRSLLALALASVTSTGLAGCTLAPVYGDAAAAPTHHALQYADPSSRLAQIVVHRLAISFPSTTDPAAPRLSVAAHVSTTNLYRTKVGDFAYPHRATVTAEVTVTRDGKTIASFSRFASADYNSVGQVVSDEQAAIEARERAAAAVAETVRLALLSALAPQ